MTEFSASFKIQDVKYLFGYPAKGYQEMTTSLSIGSPAA